MSSKQVEMFADSGREASKIKKHLDAARAKLEYLRAVRHQLKQELARALSERDEARLEIERLKSRDASRLESDRESRAEALRTERESLLRSLQEMVAELSAAPVVVDIGGEDAVGLPADPAPLEKAG
jgi:predicted nuclease with TOPRIM domain